MSQTVLVIEDEDRIASFIRRGLVAEGFKVLTAGDVATGLDLVAAHTVDLVVLDLMLPGGSGESFLATVRSTDTALPVIVLTAKDSVLDRVANLNAGADDYVTKPFSLTELIARIRARLRIRDQAEHSTSLEVGRIGLDALTRQATITDEVTESGSPSRSVDLSAREFALLDTFMRHPRQILSEYQLLDLVWGYDFNPGSNVVEVYVGYLRKKLGSEAIETVRGSGYRFVG